MKLHTKTVFVLLGILALGIALGALGQSTMHNRRMDKLQEMRRQGGLYMSIDRYIDPVDSVQEDTLKAITHRHQERLDRLFKLYRWYRSGMMDSLRTEMEPQLDSVQLEAIGPWFDRVTKRPDSPLSDSTRTDTTAVDSTTSSSE